MKCRFTREQERFVCQWLSRSARRAARRENYQPKSKFKLKTRRRKLTSRVINPLELLAPAAIYCRLLFAASFKLTRHTSVAQKPPSPDF